MSNKEEKQNIIINTLIYSLIVLLLICFSHLFSSIGLLYFTHKETINNRIFK